MDVFFEIYKDLPRAGPGCDLATKEAISKIPNLPSKSKILDVGCGPGAQTLELARRTKGQIVAIDTHQPFLDKLVLRAKEEGLLERIQPMNMSMKDLKFDDSSFDLIWSEGAPSTSWVLKRG
jgi:ubiquinone/menaquinone biosynthesis C-methylase UbiE